MSMKPITSGRGGGEQSLVASRSGGRRSGAEEGGATRRRDSLLVLAGRQHGSRAWLSRERASSVGTGFASDIVLRTGESVPLALTVLCGATGWTLSVMEGEVQVGGRTLGSGEHEDIDYGVPVQAGESRFTVERGTPHVIEEWAPSRATFGGASLPMRVAGLCCLAGGVVLLALGVVIDPLSGSENSDEPLSFEQTLFIEGFGDLVFVDRAEGLPRRLSGDVESRQREARLRELVSETGDDIVLDIQVDSALAEAIEQVYRANGIAAEVRVTGRGQAQVLTRTADRNALDRIERAIAKDLPALTALDSSNVVPVIAAPEPGPGLREDPDKAITLVVAGANGYLMTRDGSRYFIGSMLPSGHLVKELADGQVIVSKDGKNVMLDFE